jgi:hypothetical protein
VLAVAVAGVAWAGLGSGGSKDRDAVLNDVATRLGISSAKLKSAIQDSLAARVDAAVKDGRLTKEQAAEIKSHIRAGDAGIGLGPPGFGPPGFGHGGFGPGGFGHGGFRHAGAPPPIAGAAEFLGLTPKALFDQLRGGKTLADLAKAKGKSTDELEKAILDSARKQLDQAVKDKALTQAQEKQMLDHLGIDLPKLITRKWQAEAGLHVRRAPAPGQQGGFAPPPMP